MAQMSRDAFSLGFSHEVSGTIDPKLRAIFVGQHHEVSLPKLCGYLRTKAEGILQNPDNRDLSNRELTEKFAASLTDLVQTIKPSALYIERQGGTQPGEQNHSRAFLVTPDRIFVIDLDRSKAEMTFHNWRHGQAFVEIPRSVDLKFNGVTFKGTHQYRVGVGDASCTCLSSDSTIAANECVLTRIAQSKAA